MRGESVVLAHRAIIAPTLLRKRRKYFTHRPSGQALNPIEAPLRTQGVFVDKQPLDQVECLTDNTAP